MTLLVTIAIWPSVSLLYAYIPFVLFVIDEEDEEENNNLITDSWCDEMIVGAAGGMNIDLNDTMVDAAVTKQRIAEVVQESRPLIKMIRWSRILTGFINDDKKN